MPEITLICGTCHGPIEGDTGALAVSFPAILAHRRALAEWRQEHPGPVPSARDIRGFPEPLRWTPVHDKCLGPEPDDAYDIDAAVLASAGGFIEWSRQLRRKSWIGFTDWEQVLREAAGEIPSSRMRVSEPAQ